MTPVAKKTLTIQQRRFIYAYLRTWDAVKAAKEAGYLNPNVSSSVLFKNPLVKAAVEEALAQEAMEARESLARLAQQARGNVSDFIKPGKVTITKKNGDTYEISGLEFDWEAIREKGYLIKSIKSTRDGPSIELYDAQGALTLIAKHLGLLVDRTEITGKDGEPLRIEIIDVERTD